MKNKKMKEQKIEQLTHLQLKLTFTAKQTQQNDNNDFFYKDFYFTCLRPVRVLWTSN